VDIFLIETLHNYNYDKEFEILLENLFSYEKLTKNNYLIINYSFNLTRFID
jgi:hypothetical protein